jgi:hypothetical protein
MRPARIVGRAAAVPVVRGNRLAGLDHPATAGASRTGGRPGRGLVPQRLMDRPVTVVLTARRAPLGVPGLAYQRKPASAAGTEPIGHGYHPLWSRFTERGQGSGNRAARARQGVRRKRRLSVSELADDAGCSGRVKAAARWPGCGPLGPVAALPGRCCLASLLGCCLLAFLAFEGGQLLPGGSGHGSSWSWWRVHRPTVARPCSRNGMRYSGERCGGRAVLTSRPVAPQLRSAQEVQHG